MLVALRKQVQAGQRVTVPGRRGGSGPTLPRSFGEEPSAASLDARCSSRQQPASRSLPVMLPDSDAEAPSSAPTGWRAAGRIAADLKSGQRPRRERPHVRRSEGPS